MKMRAAECYCAFLSGRQSVFIAQSPTIRGEVFSVWMKTIQKLDKDMDYAVAKQTTKQPTIHVSAWPHPLEAAPISLIAGSDSDFQ